MPLDLSREVMRIEREDGSIVKSVVLSDNCPSPLENILNAKRQSANIGNCALESNRSLSNPLAQRAAAVIAFSMAHAVGDCAFKEVSQIVRWFREDAGIQYPDLIKLLIEVCRERSSGEAVSASVESFVENVPTDKWVGFFDLLASIEIADGISHHTERDFHNSLLLQLERAVVANQTKAE